LNLVNWLKPPLNWKTCYLLVFPIIISQILQRLYPVIDSRFISLLGNEPLLIHSVQYNFIIFGQFIGSATAISCLVFWSRKECVQRQGSIFLKHLLLVCLSMVALAVQLGIFSRYIMTSYKVDPVYLSLSSTYLCIGLVNMVLQAIYGSLDGMLIASGQQKRAVLISFALLIANILADAFAIYILFSGTQHPASVYYPLIFIGISTTTLILIACLVVAYLIIRKVQGWEQIQFKEILPVWRSEIGIYFIRGITPFIYALQLISIKSSSGFLPTYQLALQISYVLCLPLLASMQLAVRNASEAISKNSNHIVPVWWNELLYTGLLPTIILLIIGILFPIGIFSSVYHYVPPVDHIPFIPIFFFACLVGQFANVLTIPIRSRKKNYLMTRNFFLAEFVVMLGGTQLLIWFGLAKPWNVGVVIALFVLAQLVLNYRSTLSLTQNEKLAYEASC